MSKSTSLFPRMGVVLNGRATDETVLRFVGTIAKATGTEEIHVRTSEEGSSLRGVRDRIRRMLAKHGGKRVVAKADVVGCKEWDHDEILLMAKRNELNLLVAGRPLPSSASGHTSYYEELARKSPCTTLLVTEHSEPEFERILVPVDFSEHSARALRLALKIQTRLGDGRTPVVLQHVFPVPYKSTYLAATKSGFAGRRRTALADDFVRFNREYKVPRSRVVEITTAADQPSKAIRDLALARGTQLVVVGSRGRTPLARLLMGSTATRLVAHCAAPVLVVKKRGENLGILNALLPT